MTLLPFQHPTRTAGRPNGSKAHDDGGRYRGHGSNQACGKLRLPSLDGVEDEPRVSVPERFDVPQTADVHVWNGERLRKNCTVAIQHDDPRYACYGGSSHSLNPGLANDFIGENRHGFHVVNADIFNTSKERGYAKSAHRSVYRYLIPGRRRHQVEATEPEKLEPTKGAGHQPFLNVSTNEAPAESAADEISAPFLWSPWSVRQEYRA